jgi:hypothetical protein
MLPALPAYNGAMPGRFEILGFFFQPPTAWVLGALAAGQLLAALGRLRGTTLVAPTVWAIAAISMLVVSATFGAPDTPADHYLGYAAAIFLLAPGLAVLGAKRPQSGAWQFIVATFVGIIMLPVLNGLAAGLAAPQPHALFRWLTLAVFLVGTGNYLPTVQLIPIGSTWVGVGMLLAVCFPSNWDRSASADVVTLLFMNIGLAVAWLIARRRRRAARGMQRLWNDFRDAYGLVWGVRVFERLNVAARRHGWPVEFAWRGIFVKGWAGDDSTPLARTLFQWNAPHWDNLESEEPLERLDPDVRRRIRRELQALLRRFVSPAWIAERDDPETGELRTRRGVSAGGEHTEGR